MDQLTSSDPTHIGPYRLIGRLGAGGMGLVYLGRSEAGRTVAVKVVQAEYAQHPEFRRRFAREVAAAGQVGGAWTAAVLDSDTEAAVPWVATQYIPGPDLTAVVSKDFGPLPGNSVTVLANRLALALQAVHRAGLIHRDLKPSNVLITVDGPRVIDFGIARAMDSLAGDSLHTSTGMLIGSPGFMSPEQVRGLELTPASDVFCLGAVLVYAATGRLLFGATDTGLNAHLFRIAEEEPDLTGVPEPLLALVRDCLDKDPAKRPTPQQVAERTAGQLGGEWLPGQVLAQLVRRASQLLDYAPAAAPTPAPYQAVPTPPPYPPAPYGQAPSPFPPQPTHAPTTPAHLVPPQGYPPQEYPPQGYAPQPGFSPYVGLLPTPQDRAPEAPLLHPLRWWGLAVLALVQLTVLRDAVSLNLALPSIQAALHMSSSHRSWLFTSYAVAFAGLLLFGGHLADLLGRKRMLFVGLGGFALAAVIGGMAPNLTVLVVARALQGAFAALLSPAVLALVSVNFAEPKARGRAFGVYTAITLGGTALGLLASGWLVDQLDWRTTFYADVPLALIGALGTTFLVHDGAVRARPRPDLLGLLLGAGGLVALAYGIQRVTADGWSSLLGLALLVVGAMLLAVFFIWQSAGSDRLLPSYVAGDRTRLGACITLFLVGAGALTLTTFLTYYLQLIRGHSPIGTAIHLLPMAAAVLVGSTQLSARLLHRVPPRNLVVPGLLLTVLGLLLLTLLTPATGYTAVALPGMLLVGFGLGVAVMPLYSLATAGIAAQDAGGAAALTGTADSVGRALGLALFSSVAAAGAASRMKSVQGLSPAGSTQLSSLNARQVGAPLADVIRKAQLGGYVDTLWWSVGIALLAAVVAALLLGSTDQSGSDGI